MTAVSSTMSGRSFKDGYSSLAGVHDEMFDGNAAVRPHWQYVAEAFEGLGVAELKRRIGELQRVIRDNDVTYNIYSDPQGMSRPWELDILPFLIGSQEWALIERGLVQRAELLNLLLDDIYGAKVVFKRKILPPELIYSDGNFLWPLDGQQRSQICPLILLGADLVRDPAGQLRVLAQRTQAPSGAGYALENRVVFSQVMPSLFRDAHVHRLRGFFRSLRSSLNRLAPRADDPRVVVLTPGVKNEAYFEHAYLANYLGYTLVQGADLIVRDDQLWLKTLDGLQRVDVVLRRVDDSYCDPVELRPESFLGVPGLLQVLRRGNVALANPLGAAAVQNPALTAFLPELARFFLAEELILPSVTTHWCGFQNELSHVLANLQNLVVKSVRPNAPQRTIFGWDLSAEQLQQLRDQIKSRPHCYSAQEPVQGSTVPVLTEQGVLEPRHMVLRSFLVREEDSYRVMPGGLTRVSARPEQLMVSNQHGGSSKDTWVLASEPEKDESILLVSGHVLRAARQESEVSSRVADNLFWVGRYAERAEGLVRLLRVIQDRLNEDVIAGSSNDPALWHLLRALSHQSMTLPGFAGMSADEFPARLEPELMSLIVDPNRMGSLAQSLAGFLNAARSVRDRLSSDTRRVINDIDQQFWLLQMPTIRQPDDTRDVSDTLINLLVGLSGLVNENMTREYGWFFIAMGKRLERALNTTAFLRACFVNGTDSQPELPLLEAVLHVMDSSMTYRRRYPSGIQFAGVAQLLVFDHINPRALSFQLAELAQYAEHLSMMRKSARQSPEEQLIKELLGEIVAFDRVSLTRSDSGENLQSVARLLDRVLMLLPQFSDLVGDKYFRPEAVAQQLVPSVA